MISGEVGLRKPDPEIYRLAAERIGLPPEQIVFVDDLAANVRGAAAVGMVGVHHTDLATTVRRAGGCCWACRCADPHVPVDRRRPAAPEAAGTRSVDDEPLWTTAAASA